MTRRNPPALYKVGELAQLAGVSVRTLHHYEAIGLLVPSSRTASAHRLYARSDVERLMRIKALTSLGLSLEQVRSALDDETTTPSRLVEQHLVRARELLEEQAALCARLEHLRDALQGGDDEVETLFQTMEALTMIETYYTKEQLAQLEERRKALGDDTIAAVEREWTELFAKARAAMDAGTPPDAPEVQALARRSQELVAMFTGGDPGIAASLGRMYRENPADKIHPGFDPAVFAYLRQANEA
ncbi:MAG: MerR family transcriptional regulator [Kofleriaceae bacterium]|nr:MAG: MerR family transcriptional regulator [Kofleriaceae bacterium]MBZ0235014.1 TipAS antibiotic-recognition domain-containing protein [Kofleriaceae bacterium]